MGGWLNKWLIERITGKKVVVAYVNHIKFCRFFGLIKDERPVFTAIGSIMYYVPDGGFIWGTGCVYHSLLTQIRPGKILSVRGPLTSRVLKGSGFSEPFLYGYPALLLSKFVDEFPGEEKTYSVGVIPHHSENLHPAVRRLSKMDDVLLINIESSQEKLISDIKKCECIFSSSLHVLILSNVLDVPNGWVRFRSDFPGDGFKFNDYYASLCGAEKHKELFPVFIKEDDVSGDLVKKIKRQSSVHDHHLNMDEVEGVFIHHLDKNGWL